MTYRRLGYLALHTDATTAQARPTLKWTADNQNKPSDSGILYGQDASNGIRQYNYTIATGAIANKTASKKVVIAWYHPNDLPTRQGFEDAQSKLGAYALTHVYAVGATTNGSTAITKPNYNVVPIMGSDVHLEVGKKYEMPCEPYEQPNMQLSYFAQTMLKHQGDVSNSVAVGDNRLLTPTASGEQYNLRLIAHVNVAEATRALNAMGTGLQVPLKTDIVWGLGLVAGGTNTVARPVRKVLKSDPNFRNPSRLDPNPNRPPYWGGEAVATINSSGVRDGAQHFLALNSNGDVGKGVTPDVVTINFRAEKWGIKATDRSDLLNLYQSAYKLTWVKYDSGEIEAIWDEWSSGNSSNSDHKPWIGSTFGSTNQANLRFANKYLKVESIYLGKYFVGDIEVIRNSEGLFSKNQYAGNKVERHIPFAGELINYEDPSAGRTVTWFPDVRNVGIRTILLNDKTKNGPFTSSQSDANTWIAGAEYNSSLITNVTGSHPASQTHHPVLPISMTSQGRNPYYQGSDADW